MATCTCAQKQLAVVQKVRSATAGRQAGSQGKVGLVCNVISVVCIGFDLPVMLSVVTGACVGVVYCVVWHTTICSL